MGGESTFPQGENRCCRRPGKCGADPGRAGCLWALASTVEKPGLFPPLDSPRQVDLGSILELPPGTSCLASGSQHAELCSPRGSGTHFAKRQRLVGGCVWGQWHRRGSAPQGNEFGGAAWVQVRGAQGLKPELRASGRVFSLGLDVGQPRGSVVPPVKPWLPGLFSQLAGQRRGFEEPSSARESAGGPEQLSCYDIDSAPPGLEQWGYEQLESSPGHLDWRSKGSDIRSSVHMDPGHGEAGHTRAEDGYVPLWHAHIHSELEGLASWSSAHADSGRTCSE